MEVGISEELEGEEGHVDSERHATTKKRSIIHFLYRVVFFCIRFLLLLLLLYFTPATDTEKGFSFSL